LEDVRKTTHLMQIQRGAPTGDLNPVRNHLDQMKGGRLARHIQPARAIHIMVWIPSSWDNLMTRNTFIHSLTGTTTFAKAAENLIKWDAWDEVPQSVRDFVSAADPAHETVKADEFMRMRSRVFGVMPPSMGMLPTAKRKAEELGFKADVLYARSNFEAAPAGLLCAEIANQLASYEGAIKPPCVLLGGGEMIVTVGRENGMGGRNQEWALSSARRIAGNDQVVMASVDSDGTDGPGHQFIQEGPQIPVLDGGLVDGFTMAEAEAAGWNVDAELKRHNTSPVLHDLGCGVQATHNISMNDLTVVMVLGKR
jgi:glycerate-2-kinase